MSVEISNKHDHQEWHLRHMKDILLKTKYKKNLSRYCTLYIYIYIYRNCVKSSSYSHSNENPLFLFS